MVELIVISVLLSCCCCMQYPPPHVCGLTLFYLSSPTLPCPVRFSPARPPQPARGWSLWWWNRCRQMFLQPQGHYLKSDRDSSERERGEEAGGGERGSGEGVRRSLRKEQSERGWEGVGWAQLRRCIVQRRERVLGDKWNQQAFGTHRRLLIDPDRSIQAGLREGWEFSEGVNNLAAQLSCPIHRRQRPNQGWIPFSVWGGGSSPPPSVSALVLLSISIAPPSLLPPSIAPHFHSIGALKVIEMTAYRKRLIKLFIISLNQYVWIVKTSKSAPRKVIVTGQQQLLGQGWFPGSLAPFKATFTLT